MRNLWIIALREFIEKLKSRSFILTAFLGPILLVVFLFVIFKFGDNGKKHWDVLVTDPTGIFERKMLPQKDLSVNYFFLEDYVEMEEFRDAKLYQKFDALVEINEKVLTNKTAFVFYRQKPSVKLQTKIQYQSERRLEEVMVKRFTKLPLSSFRKIKQPLNVAFRNVYDPYDESSDIRGWVGYFYGLLIVGFVFLYGMTILRSVSQEKSNRIIEIVLGSVSPRKLMAGKMIGIGLTAIIQLFIWLVIVALGLYVMREFIFHSSIDLSSMVKVQMTEQVKNATLFDQLTQGNEQNDFLNLIYERIQFGTMNFYFILFFIAAYLFYGAFFTAIGATAGSESDGQQFIIPVLLLLVFAAFSGYYCLYNPTSQLTQFFQYLPFTAPIVAMVKLALGFEPGTVYQLFLALFSLLLGAFISLSIAGRLYSKGILQFGHRIRISQLINWLKRKE
ncbi:MAG: ABC transporter permease [Crocinitomicaceae bacterium]|nr:ABC transporter permease [Crocinitomicaceae bacterium]